MDPRERTARQAEMLAGRLRKNARHLAKWARREGVTCYRLYDRDIPEVPLTIDRYDEHLVIAAWARGDEEPAWLDALVAAATSTLELPLDHAHTRVRRRQKGLAQYEKAGDRGERMVVHEGGLRFWVNLDDYLDTGLFLDHRWARARVRAESAGQRVLNLFCYTGSFTVYAAAGGAAASTSVDLSATYLEWAADNLELNGLLGHRHELVRADVLAWLDRPPEGAPYDVIVLDPPSFSNSKKMRGVLDTERDHPFLVRACLARLAPGGTLYFSTNHRSLKLATDELGPVAIEDLTRPSIPPDFRDAKIHRLWAIRHAPA